MLAIADTLGPLQIARVLAGLFLIIQIVLLLGFIYIVRLCLDHCPWTPRTALSMLNMPPCMLHATIVAQLFAFIAKEIGRISHAYIITSCAVKSSPLRLCQSL